MNGLGEGNMPNDSDELSFTKETEADKTLKKLRTVITVDSQCTSPESTVINQHSEPRHATAADSSNTLNEDLVSPNITTCTC